LLPFYGAARSAREYITPTQRRRARWSVYARACAALDGAIYERDAARRYAVAFYAAFEAFRALLLTRRDARR